MKAIILTATLILLLSTAFLNAVEPQLVWTQVNANRPELKLEGFSMDFDYTDSNRILVMSMLDTNSLDIKSNCWHFLLINSQTGEIIDSKFLESFRWLSPNLRKKFNNHYKSNDTLYFNCIKSFYAYPPFLMPTFYAGFANVKVHLHSNGLDFIPAYSDGCVVDTTSIKGAVYVPNEQVPPNFYYLKDDGWYANMFKNNVFYTCTLKVDTNVTTQYGELKLDTINSEYILSYIPDLNTIEKSINSMGKHNINDTLIMELFKVTDTFDIGYRRIRGIFKIDYNIKTGKILSCKTIDTTTIKYYNYSRVTYKNGNFYTTALSTTYANDIQKYSDNIIIRKITAEGQLLDSFNISPSITPMLQQYKNNGYGIYADNFYYSDDTNYMYAYGSIRTVDSGFAYAYKGYIAKYKIKGVSNAQLVWEYILPYSTLLELANDGILVKGSDIYLQGISYPYGNELWGDSSNKVWFKLTEPTSIYESTSITRSMVSPNPTNLTSTLTLDLQDAGNLKITLNDLLGHTLLDIHDGFTDAGTFTKAFSLEALPQGIYYIKVIHNGDVKVEKVIRN